MRSHFFALVLAVIANTSFSIMAADGEKKGDALQEPKIVEVKEIKYVGMRISHKPFENSSSVIPKLWDEFQNRNGEIKDKSGPSLGVAGDFIEKDKSASYIAAAQVERFDSVPEGMEKGVVPAGTYAAFKHKGPISTFGKTVTYIHGVWLPKSGFKNKGAMVEVYPKDSDVDAAGFEMTVLVPISK
jgi:predicted transcriptional regulator YdeE